MALIFGMRGDIADVIARVKFDVNWFRGFGALTANFAILHRLGWC